ncbi:MAG TPA: DUF3095 domain-containing protein [Microvirga sp.]|nr:DUF3095 domain-containing protein [Microvirga sp.]
MDPQPAPDPGFYESLPVLDSFAQLADPAVYTPLPDGWVLGLSDIVHSTAAIEAGRYKTVNAAAAGVIAAVANALPESDFPFVFGGDGASFALPPEQAERGRAALAAVAAWVRDELGLALRVAMLPVAAVRAAGLDVRIARYGPSRDVSYAMFTGGGLAWAEARLKEGAFAIAPAEPGTRPDLTGLSCRFAEIESERGVILSLIVVPAPGADMPAFGRLIRTVLALAESGAEAGRPVPAGGPPPRLAPAGFDIEARARRRPGRSPVLERLSLRLRMAAAYLVFRSGLRVGGFDPRRYVRELVENTDFRKFDDALRMTLDCTPALADRLEALLAGAERDGVARAGIHRQNAALMTCFVPSATRSDHVHFVDGAQGGYAAAARAIKP